jgi:hypothetical protein
MILSMANEGIIISLGTGGASSIIILNFLKMLDSDSPDIRESRRMICEEQLHLK